MNARKEKKRVPDEVLKEVAKADLARSNQWLVGAFIVSVPVIVMVITFANLALSNPKMEFAFWTGCFMGIFVPLGSISMSIYARTRAIKALCQIHEREVAPRPSSNGTN
jgi:hypothetical protein